MRTFEPKHFFRLQVVFFWMGSFFIAQNRKFKLKILIKRNIKNVPQALHHLKPSIVIDFSSLTFFLYK
jgi:hypothetical protein